MKMKLRDIVQNTILTTIADCRLRKLIDSVLRKQEIYFKRRKAYCVSFIMPF